MADQIIVEYLKSIKSDINDLRDDFNDYQNKTEDRVRALEKDNIQTKTVAKTSGAIAGMIGGIIGFFVNLLVHR